jgi:hypothetical protein
MATKLTTSSRQSTYVFGRLNLIAEYADYEAKYRILSSALRNNRSLPFHDSEWSFANVSDIDNDGSPVLHGFVVKSGSLRASQIDKDSHTLHPIDIEDLAQATSRFFLDVKSGLIAFHPSSKIKVDVFTSRFKSLVAHNEFMVNAEISMIQERFEVLARMADFDVISRVSITLHPSNPKRDKIWHDLDKGIQDLNIATLRYIADGKADDGGLNKPALLNDPDIKAKLTMAEDGYGKGKVDGKIAGKPASITTGRKPITAQAGEGDGQPKSIFELLRDAFKKLDGRTDSPK